MSSTTRPEDSIPTNDHTLHAGLSCMIFVGDRSHLVELPLVGSVVVGRGSEADLRVLAEGVSRKHAVIQLDRDTITVSDLSSKNGTHVNGARIVGARRIGHGDEIRVGEARLVISRRSSSTGSTSILLHGAFTSRLRVEAARAQGFGRALSLVLVKLERPWFDSGLAAILGQHLRPVDVVGLYDDATAEILLPEKDAAEAKKVAAGIAAGARGLDLACATGLATLERGGSAEELLELAVAALRGARGERTDEDVAPIVADPVMRHIYEQIRRVAKSRVAVLVMGETGAGKELVARAIHAESGRRGRLVAVNAAALPEALLESELFGHEKGAFTGAAGAKAGLFEAAQGGTLFLDEVGDLPLALQAKLLRVLEDGSIRRVGATSDRRVDVRVVAATNAELGRLCAERRFRQDLLFRLNACTFVVPPLRDRPLDIRALAEHFVDRAGGGRGLRLSPEAAALLERYSWPGNVRELRNVIDRAALLCESPDAVIRPQHLPDSLQGGPVAVVLTPPPPRASSVREEIRDYERERVEKALAAAGGNLTKAAELLKLPRKTLAYRLEKLGIRPSKG